MNILTQNVIWIMCQIKQEKRSKYCNAKSSGFSGVNAVLLLKILMTIYSIQPLVAFILNISLILLILLIIEIKITLAYIFWNLSMAVWNLGFFLLYNTSEYLLAVKYNHILISGTIFIFLQPFILFICCKHKTKLNKTLLYLAYFFSFYFYCYTLNAIF